MKTDQLLGNGLTVVQWGEHPLSDFGGGKLALQLNPSRPALLIATLVVDNQEGRRSNDQHTISALAEITINGKLYARDYSAYYVWDGVASANASCHKLLQAGTRYNVLARAGSSQDRTTQGQFAYSVYQINSPFPDATKLEPEN